MASIRSGNRHRQRNQARVVVRAVENRRIDRIVDEAVEDALAGRTVMIHTMPGMGIRKRFAVAMARRGRNLVPARTA